VIKVSVSYMFWRESSVPAKSVAELVASFQGHPDKFNFLFRGLCTPAHLLGEMFKLKTGVARLHVPYQGAGAQRLADFLNGTSHFSFTTYAVVDLVAPASFEHLPSPRRGGSQP